MIWKEQIIPFDQRRNIVKPGDRGATLAFAVDQWITIAQESIEKRGAFYVALSGGSTPTVIFQALSNNKETIDWSKVYLFWSDERVVASDDPESNYKMAMDSGLSDLPIPEDHIFRMKGELDPKIAAEEYNHLIIDNVPGCIFDLIMLGMGPDGHTASLFPDTTALHAKNKEAAANFIPQKDAWRLTLTFSCINRARHISIYVIGEDKAETLRDVLTGPSKPDQLPAQKIGTTQNKALWIADDSAAALIPSGFAA